jgi:DNA-binding NtrC family response regulator
VATILLIDDDPNLRAFLQRGLNEQGHQVQSVERAEPARRLLAEASIDLILLDNIMPGMTGIEFLGMMKQCGLRVPVILMTGEPTTDTAITATKLGAFDYVIKPLDLQELQDELEPLIREALEQFRPPLVQLQSENLSEQCPGMLLLGKSKPMLEVYKRIGRFAQSNDPVMILGETGSGKELVARAIHTNSSRRDMPFVALNCTALVETLLDDELFGHEKGAFSGADKLRKGKFEHSDGGTLFLDELGDMPFRLQAKLLRVLESQEVCRIGDNEPIKVNVRIISATHRDLEAAVAEGAFRQDLLFRLNRLTIPLPALRERGDDLELLARHFLARAAQETGVPPPALPPSTLAELRRRPWPGNVRELQNVIYRAVRLCRGTQLLPEHIPSPGPVPPQDPAGAHLHSLIQWAWESGKPRLQTFLQERLERELLRFALEELDGNQTQVAKRLGISRNTVIQWIEKYLKPGGDPPAPRH